MNTADVVTALDLPSGSRVDQRVPKKLFLEHAPTSADRRRITEGIGQVQWLAALKPATIGVPLFRDGVREYLEIAVLGAMLREGAKAARIVEVIHRAVPYPVFLIAEQRENLSLSLAHKRWSESEAGTTVLDVDIVAVNVSDMEVGAPIQAFRDSLALRLQSRAHLHALGALPRGAGRGPAVEVERPLAAARDEHLASLGQLTRARAVPDRTGAARPRLQRRCGRPKP